jgi:broad specificity phosphatase PhoE
MRIFLIRHGRSEGKEDPDRYKTKGNPSIELTPEGWEQSVAAGQFLKIYLNTHPRQSSARHGPAKPMRLWASTHMRTRQTAAGILEGLQGVIPPEVRISNWLVEQDFGLFSHLPNEADRQAALKLFTDFYNTREAQDKFYARPPMGESPADVTMRARIFIDKLMRDREKGVEDVVLVTHGVTLRAFAMTFMNIDPGRYNEFKTPQNTSLYVIEDDSQHHYSLRQIYNGQTRQAVDIDWGKKLGAYETILPPVPPQFRISR